MKGLFNRLLLLGKLKQADIIFVHRETTPLGLPWMEWVISRLFKKLLVYDFDDAIWMADNNSKNWLIRRLKDYGKVKRICCWSNEVSCGNQFLADYALRFNDNVKVIPTTIDTQFHHVPVDHVNESITIGWTGTQSTLPYLNAVIPIIEKLSFDYEFVLKVICNVKPDFDFPWLQFIPWNLNNEIKDLNSFDIGIMPLPNTTWAQGKCGFKILQYMALEKAAVASAVGVNTEIIEHGESGLLCRNLDDWYYNLQLLITDKELRAKLGKKGRKTVQLKFSKSANREKFLNLFP